MTYDDHGYQYGWVVLESLPSSSTYLPWLGLSYSFADACLTNDFKEGQEYTFGMTFMRRGGIGYHGAVTPSWSGGEKAKKTMEILTDPITPSFGDLNRQLLIQRTNRLNEDFVFLGDPVLVPHVKEVDWS
jgi:hypothetical protein